MNILLINPWVTDFWEVGYWTKPIGLLYVASFLAKRGHAVRLIDCMDKCQDGKGAELTVPSLVPFRPPKIRFDVIETPAPLAKYHLRYRRHGIPVELFESLALDGPKPDVILVTSVMTYWYHGAFEAISRVRELFPGVPVLLGGVYARLCAEHARENSGADAVVTERLPGKVIEAVEAGGGQQGSGPVASDAFSEWPDPLWELYGSLPVAVLMTSIGCPLRCTACASFYLTNDYARRRPQDAVASILRLADRGVTEIGFMDDALLKEADDYALPMFRELTATGTPVKFSTPNGVHISEITPELAKAMYTGGMVGLTLSIETISKKRMKTFSSKTSMEQFKQAVNSLLDAGFHPTQLYGYILFGMPGQLIDEAIETKAFVASLGIEPRVLVFTPVPQTVEYKRAVESGIIEANCDPALHNNKLRAMDYFSDNPDQRTRFRELFGIERLRSETTE